MQGVTKCVFSLHAISPYVGYVIYQRTLIEWTRQSRKRCCELVSSYNYTKNVTKQKIKY